jgi:hypothetical protein
VRQDVGGQQPVVGAAEPARQCLGQPSLAVARPALRQPRQQLPDVLPAGQRRHDRPSGLGRQPRDHRAGFDRGVLRAPSPAAGPPGNAPRSTPAGTASGPAAHRPGAAARTRRAPAPAPPAARSTPSRPRRPSDQGRCTGAGPFSSQHVTNAPARRTPASSTPRSTPSHQRHLVAGQPVRQPAQLPDRGPRRRGVLPASTALAEDPDRRGHPAPVHVQSRARRHKELLRHGLLPPTASATWTRLLV